jgi:hypothetical protein
MFAISDVMDIARSGTGSATNGFAHLCASDREHYACLIMVLTWLATDPDASGPQSPTITEQFQSWGYDLANADDPDAICFVVPDGVEDEVAYIDHHDDRLRARAQLLADYGAEWMSYLRWAISTLQLSHESSKKSAPRTKAEPRDASDRGQLTWRETQKRLSRMRERNLPYTNQADLAERIGCSQATINKAFDPPPESLEKLVQAEQSEAKRAAGKLQGWRARTRPTTKAKPAGPLERMPLNSQAQRTESDPSEQIIEEDHERIIEQVKAVSSPQERERIEAMPARDRRELADVYRDQHADNEPNPLEPRSSGKVRSHKRA